MSWLFWVSLIILLIGVFMFMYGSVELINHNSNEDSHKIIYWAGFALEILGLIGIVYVIFAKGREKYKSTNYYKNKMSVANERERIYGLGKAYEADQKAAALSAKQLAQQKLAAYDPNNPFNSL